MGKGIAATIKRHFPAAYKIDQKTIKGDKSKMGTITFVEIDGIIVINAYTQNTYWDKDRMLSYPAVRKCMQEVKKVATGRKIGLPKIGAGLACGDWNTILGIIEEELEGEDITIYVL